VAAATEVAVTPGIIKGGGILGDCHNGVEA